MNRKKNVIMFTYIIVSLMFLTTVNAYDDLSIGNYNVPIQINQNVLMESNIQTNNKSLTYNYDEWNSSIDNVVIDNITAMEQTYFDLGSTYGYRLNFPLLSNNTPAYFVKNIPYNSDNFNITNIKLKIKTYSANESKVIQALNNIYVELRANSSETYLGDLIESYGNLYENFYCDNISLIDNPLACSTGVYSTITNNKTIIINSSNYFICVHGNETKGDSEAIATLKSNNSDTSYFYNKYEEFITPPASPSTILSNFYFEYDYIITTPLNETYINLNTTINENQLEISYNDTYKVNYNVVSNISLNQSIQSFTQSSYNITDNIVNWNGSILISSFELGNIVKPRNISIIFPEQFSNINYNSSLYLSENNEIIAYTAQTENFIIFTPPNMRVLRETTFNLQVNGLYDNEYNIYIYKNNSLKYIQQNIQYNITEIINTSTLTDLGVYRCVIIARNDSYNKIYGEFDIEIWDYTSDNHFIVVTDSLNRTIPNKNIQFKNSELNVNVILKTNENGKIYPHLPLGMYNLTWNQTDFEGNMIAVKYNNFNIEFNQLISSEREYFVINYSVYIKDAEGFAFIGIVEINGIRKETNKEGMVTFELLEGNYTANIIYNGEIIYSVGFVAEKYTNQTITCNTNLEIKQNLPIYVWIIIASIVIISISTIIYYARSIPKKTRLKEAVQQEINDKLLYIYDVVNICTLLIIEKKSGQSVFDIRWNNDMDTDLISGFFTALTSWEAEISRGETNLGFEQMKYKSKNIYAIEKENFYLVVFSNDEILSIKTKNRLKLLANEIERKAKHDFINFNGGIGIFKEIIPPLIKIYIDEKYQKLYRITKVDSRDKKRKELMHKYLYKDKYLMDWFKIFINEYNSDKVFLSKLFDEFIDNETFIVW